MEESSESSEDGGENSNLLINTLEDEQGNEQTQPEASSSNQNLYLNAKRVREMDEAEQWFVVGRDGKRIKHTSAGATAQPLHTDPQNYTNDSKVEVYITASEELPKQFAFARLMKDNKIVDILEIKYINPYKIYIHFENETCLDSLISCQIIKDKGWNISRTTEVATSYGVIRGVELDLTEKEILESLDSGMNLLTVKRLTRRLDDGKWVDSECVRLGFKGSSLPAYIYVHGMRVKVKPYNFPVTQCSNCWKFGHVKKMCPRTKIVCPKCGKNHNNCETTKYVCVNCTGNHLSLSKTCPTYLKERKIRTIKSDFNVTYRKALSMYVPDSPHRESKDASNHLLAQPVTAFPRLGPNLEDQELNIVYETKNDQGETSYATVTKKEIRPQKSSKKKSNQKK